MSFGGPIDSMINSIKHNMGLLGKRRRLKEIQAEYKNAPKSPLKISPSQGDKLEQFHAKIRHQKREEKRRFVLIVGLTLVILFLLLLLVVTADYSSVIDLIE